MEGDNPCLSQMLILSPVYGRFQQRAIETGETVEPGSILGVFLSWLAWAGERVAPGVPVAWIARGPASVAQHPKTPTADRGHRRSRGCVSFAQWQKYRICM